MAKYRYFSVHDFDDLGNIFEGYKVIFRYNGKNYTVDMTYLEHINYRFTTVPVFIMCLEEPSEDNIYIPAEIFKETKFWNEFLVEDDEKLDAIEVKAWVENELHSLCFVGSDNVEKEIYINVF